MSIDYKFNVWRVSGERAEAWSPRAYRLISYNQNSESMSGYTIGKVLYLHHLKRLDAKQIREQLENKIPINMIKGIIRGFNKKYQTAKTESYEAYAIAMYMVEHHPEELEKIYLFKISRL
ncbi:hypothetical protein RZN25_02735 [Bacillaceae bacterium S4-13-56]